MESAVQISVVMPLYNNANEVERALRSVVDQTIPDFNVFVVNNGSTDGSGTVVRISNDKRIRIIDQQNQGVSAARNRGVAEAKNKLVALHRCR